MDEPCFALAEMNQKTPDQHAFHRYRLLYVVRDDRLAEYREDLGAQEWVREPIQIPGGVMDTTGHCVIEHTVGELIDIAEYFQAQDPFAQKLGWAPSDLLTIRRNEHEEIRQQRAHRSTYGPLIERQRD